ncbi:MAG TPA: hypothetical protein EYQ86_05050, partial [Bacteroidetes bacterium]|nr:hypothetical protein [Bacteroidota bacterium]
MICIDFKNIREDNYIDVLNEKFRLNRMPYHDILLSFLDQWFGNNDTFIIKTSGSTGGGAKELSFDKQQMIDSANVTLTYFSLKQGDKALLCLPIDYIAGKMMLVRALVGGLKLFVVEPSSDFWDELDESIDFAAVVPLQLENADPNKISYIKSILIGGAPINDRLKDQLDHSQVRFYESFGMSESLSHFAMKNLSNGEECFKLLGGVEANASKEGQLSVKVPWISSSWLKTDDRVVFKDIDKFEWLGRFSDIINTGGVKVSPFDCEKRLTLPLRTFFGEDRSFYMTSLPEPSLGQKVVLIIEGEKKTGLREVITQHLEKYEAPKNIIFIEKFKYSSSGKILKAQTK